MKGLPDMTSVSADCTDLREAGKPVRTDRAGCNDGCLTVTWHVAADPRCTGLFSELAKAVISPG